MTLDEKDNSPVTGAPGSSQVRETVARYLRKLISSAAATSLAISVGCATEPRKPESAAHPGIYIDEDRDYAPCCDPAGPVQDESWKLIGTPRPGDAASGPAASAISPDDVDVDSVLEHKPAGDEISVVVTARQGVRLQSTPQIGYGRLVGVADKGDQWIIQVVPDEKANLIQVLLPLAQANNQYARLFIAVAGPANGAPGKLISRTFLPPKGWGEPKRLFRPCCDPAGPAPDQDR